MSKYIFVDHKKSVIGIANENEILELKFFDNLIGNIYRGKVVNKIDAINGYFALFEDENIAFIKSKVKYKIGDNIIFQYVRVPSNNKKALGSTNYTLENESYILRRYQKNKKPILKKGKKANKTLKKEIIDRDTDLENQKNFFPSPKLLYENSYKDYYIKKNKELDLVEINVDDFKPFTDFKKTILDKKLLYKDYSIIIDNLETLTVIDVNSGSKKSTNNKDKFLENINLELIPFIVKTLRLRNIGGMIIIDLLRNTNKDVIINKFEEELEKSGLSYEIFGFSNMGLFELSIKRRGDRLDKDLLLRNIIS